MVKLVVQTSVKIHRGFAQLRILELDKPISGIAHRYKYRLVYLEQENPRVLYDVHTGKPDHKHVDGQELPYGFKNLDRLIADFFTDIERLPK